MRSEYRHACYFGVALLVVLGVFYLPWLSNQQAVYLSDLNYYFEPFCRFIGGSLRQGRWPLWNPYSYCGMSQIAIPSPGVFYPPNWIFAFTTYSQGLAVLMVFHQWLAGVGGFALAQSWRWSSPAAWVCGLILALNGYMFSLQPNYTLVHSIAWLPILLWSVQATVDTKFRVQPKFLLLSAVSTAMLVAAGRPEVAAPALLLLALYMIYLSWLAIKSGHDVKQTVGAFAWAGSSIICGLLISMPVVMPSLEWASLSVRSQGLELPEVFLWSSNWYDFLSLLLNQPLGDLEILGAKYLPVAAARGNHIPYVLSSYVGPIAVTLAIWGLCNQRFRQRWFLTVLLLVAVLMSLGSYTPVAPWLIKHIPFLAVFRYPEKLLVFVIGFLSIAAGQGMQALQEGKPEKSAEISAGTFWLVWTLLCLGLLLSAHWTALAMGVKNLFGVAVSLQVMQQVQELIAWAGLKVALLGFLVCFSAGYFLRHKSNYRNYSLVVVSGIAASLLVAACFSSRHGTYKDFFERPSILKLELQKLGMPEAVRQQAGFRALALFFDPLTYPGKRKPSAESTADFYQYGRQLLLPNTHMDAESFSPYGYESAETGAYRRLFRAVYAKSAANKFVDQSRADDVALWRFCQMTSTGYAYTQAYKRHGRRLSDLQLLDRSRFELVSENRRMNLRIYKVRDFLPRIYFPDSWVVYGNQQDVINGIIKSEASAFDPLQCAWLEIQDAQRFAGVSSQVVANDRPLLLQLESKDPEHLTAKVKLSQKRLMVLSDQFYPGWQAGIDGVACPILRANGILKAVLVPAGTHRVDFAYAPGSLYGGCLLAVLGCAGLLATCTLGFFIRFKAAEA